MCGSNLTVDWVNRGEDITCLEPKPLDCIGGIIRMEGLTLNSLGVGPVDDLVSQTHQHAL